MEIAGFSNLWLIGHGSIGSVYRATRDSTGSVVAIKVLREWQDREAAWKMARPDLRAMIDLGSHPSVVRIEELIDAGDTLGIVAEYTAGGSLAHLMKQQEGVLTLPQALFAGRRIVATLQVAHQRGVIHRGLKPTNVLIDPFGQVKVSDYGLARLARSDALAEQTLAANFRFTSPEDLDLSEVTPATDIYSLGALLHYGVTGTFATPTPADTDDQVGGPAIEGESDESQAGFYRLVGAMLRRDPADRPGLDEVMEAMDNLGSQASTSVAALPVHPLPTPDVDATVQRSSLASRESATVAPEPTVPRTIEAPVPAGAGAYQPAPTQALPQYAYPQAEPPRKRSSFMLVAAAIAAAVAVIAAAGLVIIVARGQSNAAESGSAGSRTDRTSRDSEDEVGASVDTTEPISATTDVDTFDTVADPTTPETTEAFDATATTSPPTPPPDPQTVARDDLNELIDTDRSILMGFYQQYIPQLSAKQYDWTEPTTGVRYTWPEILADHQTFRTRNGAVIAAPFEFASTDNPWFLTLVPTAFASKDGVAGWCNSNGYIYGETCIARLIDQVP